VNPSFVTVSRVTKENHDTMTLSFARSEFPNQGAFQPGQFNMLYAFGAGEVPISISGDPDDSKTFMHTIRAVGLATDALCAIKPGQQIGVRGPFGIGWPVQQARGRDVILMAGGLGLAPLRPVIYSLLNHRNDFGKVFILFGARSPEEIIFQKEIARWKARADIHFAATVDHSSPGWYERVGVVTTLLQDIKVDPKNTVAMLCGPEIMMRFGARDLLRMGVPAESLYVSLERNMKCGVGHCGHCQLGPLFLCKDGPVHRFDTVTKLMQQREL
jgi:NAD(P)H-flavin reductase